MWTIRHFQIKTFQIKIKFSVHGPGGGGVRGRGGPRAPAVLRGVRRAVPRRRRARHALRLLQQARRH